MTKKIVLIVLALLGLAALGWSQTTPIRHSDYSTGMEIKFCNDCHAVNNVEPNHGSLWMQEHRKYREKLPSNCNDCHQQNYCLDCHYGGGIDRDLHVSQFNSDFMPRSHRTDFREIHPIKALDDPRSCYRCHNNQRFCNQCHEQFKPQDLRYASHRRGWSDLETKKGGPRHAEFSPSQCQTCHPNSALPTTQWSSQHGQEALRNLKSCQSCHYDGSICLKCHSAKTGLMINPHPSGWNRTQSRLSSASKSTTCKQCHITIPQ